MIWVCYESNQAIPRAAESCHGPGGRRTEVGKPPPAQFKINLTNHSYIAD